MKKTKILKIFTIIAWTAFVLCFISGFLNEKLLFVTGLSVLVLLAAVILSFFYRSAKKKDPQNLQNEDIAKKTKVLKIFMIIAWAIYPFFFFSFLISEELLALTGISGVILVVAVVFTFCYHFSKKKMSASARQEQSIATAKQNAANAAKEKPDTAKVNDRKTQTHSDTNEFDAFMCAQLIVFYKMEHDKKYMDEYIRRLVHIGFTKGEAFNLFTNESMNMKHDSIALLQNPDYITAFYFDLQHKLLAFDNAYYIEHRMFTVSEITKIWDEAEWHYHNSHETDMPEDVWHEIYMLTRYGSGELFVKTLTGIAKSANISEEKIQNYARHEQDMLFKYKWNKAGNEPHPYH